MGVSRELIGVGRSLTADAAIDWESEYGSPRLHWFECEGETAASEGAPLFRCFDRKPADVRADRGTGRTLPYRFAAEPAGRGNDVDRFDQSTHNPNRGGIST